MKKKLFMPALFLVFSFFSNAQVGNVGVNTETPQSRLDVNGSIQLRNELQVNGTAGTAGQVYFSQGNAALNDWKPVNIPFLEDGQYQLVNTYAKRDQLGIDWIGANARVKVFEETFESNSSTKSSWTQSYDNGSVNWNLSATGLTSSITSPHGGSMCATFKGANSTSNSTQLISPVLDFSGYSSNLTLGFWYGQPGSNTANRNYLQLYYRYSTNGGINWSSWTTLGSEYQGNQSSWTEVSDVLLTNSAGNLYQISFDALQRGTGVGNILDDVQIYTTIASAYNATLSTLGETITSKPWVRIPGLDLPIKVNSNQNRISMIFQTGAESRLNTGSDGSAQTAGYIRYMCGIFSRKSNEASNAAKLVAVRPNQVDNYTGKTNQQKAQNMLTMTYVVKDSEAGNYVFSTACRRLSRSNGGGSDATSLFSIGNRVDSGDSFSSDFMMNSIVKMDIIDLVTVTGN